MPLVLEIIVFIIMLIFLSLRIVTGDNTYLAWATLFGSIQIGFRLYEKFIATKSIAHAYLDFDSENTMVCEYRDNYVSSERFALLFYGMKVVNSSGEPFTIKDISLKYTYESKKYSTISTVVITGTNYDPLTKKTVDSLIVHTLTNNIVLRNWQNIRTEIGKHNIIESNGVLFGSALFILEINNITDIKDIEDFTIVITDYSKKSSIHPIEIEEQWIKQGKNTYIQPKSFYIDEDGVINYD